MELLKRDKKSQTDQTIKIPATVYPWQKRKNEGNLEH